MMHDVEIVLCVVCFVVIAKVYKRPEEVPSFLDQKYGLFRLKENSVSP